MAARRSPSTPMPTSGDVDFADLDLPRAVVEQLSSLGIRRTFPIQAMTLPDSLAGRDVLGRGRTGSGKTYAFLLPVVTRLAGARPNTRPRLPRGLVLAPTRELATQIESSLKPLAEAMGLRTQTVFGGVPEKRQIRALREGVDILIACPGRLADLIRTGNASLDGIEITVLDEADHMADLGFLPVVRRILDRTPKQGQRLLFSATLDRGVDVLVRRYLTDPVVHSVDEPETPVSTMRHHVLHVDSDARLRVITDLAAAPGRTVVFTRTKFGAKGLARKLNAAGVPSVELHGNLSQNARTRNLASFSSGEATTLVATDIAARGIHVDDVALVIHADPPVEHKAYLHRSGRTARAGAEGTVVTIMLDAQVRDVRDLTRKAGISPVTTRVSPGHAVLAEIAPGERAYVAAADRAAAGPHSEAAANHAAPRGGSGRQRSRRPRRSSPSRQQGTAGASRKGDGGQRSGAQGPSPKGNHSAAGFSASVRGR